MKEFLIKLFLFFIVISSVVIAGMFLPATPKSKSNMLSYKNTKDSLLENVKTPRIIFIGGSNLVFGLDSQMIKDSLNLNPINNGLAASIGLIYMLDDVLPYVKKGDILVLAPEYHNYFGNYAYGGNDLLRVLLDFERDGFLRLRYSHVPNLMKSVPIIFLSKIKPRSYLLNSIDSIYSNKIFNIYGDSEYHRALKKKEFIKVMEIKGSFNYDLVNELKFFEKRINKKEATLIISYPCFQQSSYNYNIEKIGLVNRVLHESGLKIGGIPENYIIPDSLIFDQAYHPTKGGIKLRTLHLIEDLKTILH